MGRDDGEGEKRNASAFIVMLLGEPQAHLNSPALYFSVFLLPKISALISRTDPDLGAFHFIKHLWVLQPEISPNGLKYCFYVLYGIRGRKGERNAGHIFAWRFHTLFSSPHSLHEGISVGFRVGVNKENDPNLSADTF